WPDAVRPPARAPDGVVVKGTGRTHGVGRSVAGTASGAWQAYSRHAAPGDIRDGALRRHAALRLAPGLSRFGGDLFSRTAPLTFPAPHRRGNVPRSGCGNSAGVSGRDAAGGGRRLPARLGGVRAWRGARAAAARRL